MNSANCSLVINPFLKDKCCGLDPQPTTIITCNKEGSKNLQISKYYTYHQTTSQDCDEHPPKNQLTPFLFIHLGSSRQAQSYLQAPIEVEVELGIARKHRLQHI
jgi:hypothetical protein